MKLFLTIPRDRLIKTMTNLEKFIEKQRVRIPSNRDQATVQYLFLEFAEALNKDLVNKPVETTNERLTKCHCGSLLPKDGKSCGSMWCPNEH